MINVSNIEFHSGSREERLPGFASDFPYIASCSELDQFKGRFVPWHWHKAVELFYMEKGDMVYHTPKGEMLFEAGSGGFINSNVLHMTKPGAAAAKSLTLLHIFDPTFIAGEHGSRIEQKYVTPLILAPQAELIPLTQRDPVQAEILADLRSSFRLSEQESGYELKLREILSDIWFRLFSLSRSLLAEKGASSQLNDQVKLMMVYIHEHYTEKISVAELSAAAFLSERECFRVFQSCLHMTPVDYLKSYRLQMACQMLLNSHDTITSISHACGLGSSSYFGKVFREYTGCTPIEYRQNWQDSYR